MLRRHRLPGMAGSATLRRLRFFLVQLRPPQRDAQVRNHLGSINAISEEATTENSATVSQPRHS
jgi:hypothetical protein